ATGTITLTLVNKPAADFSFNTACAGNPTTFMSSVTSNAPVAYSWSFGNNLPTSAQANPSYNYTDGGTYNVQLTVTSQPCQQHSATVVKPVTIHLAKAAIRYPEKMVLENDPLGLQARNIGNSYTWSPATNLNNPS